MKLLTADHVAMIRAADAAAGDDLQGCPSAWTERRDLLGHIDALGTAEGAPIPLLLWCPACGQRHIDEGAYAVQTHHTHACQSCGMVWRPALVSTVGVQFLPGFKNPEPEPEKCGLRISQDEYCDIPASECMHRRIGWKG